MERRDRIAHLRQQAAGHVVPRAIGGEVDERDIIEMMERRAMAEADDDAEAAGEGEGGSGKAVQAEGAGVSREAVQAADAAAAADDDNERDAAAGDGSDSGSSGSSGEEESEGSWSDQEGEGEGDDSDIEEFYLKGGEGQMDEVEKKRAAAAEQKLVQVRACAFVRALTPSPMHECRYNSRRSGC